MRRESGWVGLGSNFVTASAVALVEAGVTARVITQHQRAGGATAGQGRTPCLRMASARCPEARGGDSFSRDDAARLDVAIGTKRMALSRDRSFDDLGDPDARADDAQDRHPKAAEEFEDDGHREHSQDQGGPVRDNVDVPYDRLLRGSGPTFRTGDGDWSSAVCVTSLKAPFGRRRKALAKGDRAS